MTDDDKSPVWAGFWRRLIGFFVDGLILGAIGFALTAPMFSFWASLEGPTRLIGGAAGLLYFGFLSSGPGGGATPGMRLLGMKVVSMKGRPIGLLRSLWRALVLQAPLTLNGLYLTLDDPLWVQVYAVVAMTLVFGVGLAQIVLLIFNHPSRRLMHDLLSGSAVVRAHAAEPPGKARSPVPAIAFLIVAIACGSGLWLTLRPPALGQTLTELTAAQRAVQALPEVLEAGVHDNTTTYWGDEGKTTTRTLVITARLRAPAKDQDAEVERVAEAALSVYKLAPGQQVRVVLKRGYDIGIASAWRSYQTPYTPRAKAQAAGEPADDAEAAAAEAEADAAAAAPAAAVVAPAAAPAGAAAPETPSAEAVNPAEASAAAKAPTT